MRRIGLISLYVLAALAGLIVILWIGVFYTPPGRQFLEGAIEDQLGGALNSNADIGALNGAPPGHLVASDIRLTDETGAPWLTIERLELRWRPLALLRKNIIIDEATLIHAQLLGDPPEGEKKDDDEARQIKILDSLPHIEIAALTIDNFETAINGAQHHLNAKGSVRLNGPDIALFLNAESDTGADQAAIAFAKSPDTESFSLDASIFADTGGAVASLLGLNGATELRASGESPVADGVITIEGNVGYYGAISAEIESSFDTFDGADINGMAATTFPVPEIGNGSLRFIDGENAEFTGFVEYEQFCRM